MKAQSNLRKIVLVPPVGTSTKVNDILVPIFDQYVQVYLDNYNGISFPCGTSSSIFTDFEFDCGLNKGY